MKTEPRNALSLFLCLSLHLSLCVLLGSVGTVVAECCHYSSRATFLPPLCVTLFVVSRLRFSSHCQKTKQQKMSAGSSLWRRPRLTRRHCRHDVTAERSEGIPVGTGRAGSGSERGRCGKGGRAEPRGDRRERSHRPVPSPLSPSHPLTPLTHSFLVLCSLRPSNSFAVFVS